MASTETNDPALSKSAIAETGQNNLEQATTDAIAVPDIQTPKHAVDTAVLPENHDKNYVKALTLTTLFGMWGVDRFYLGKVGSGIAKLLTFGGFGLWYLTDGIITFSGAARQKGKESLELEDTQKYKPFFVRITAALAIVYVGLFLIQIAVFAYSMPKIIDQLKGVENQVQPGSSSQSQQLKDLQKELQESQL